MKIASGRLEAIKLSAEEKALLKSASLLMRSIASRMDDDDEKLGYEVYGEYHYLSRDEFIDAMCVVDVLCNSCLPLLIFGNASDDDFIDWNIK